MNPRRTELERRLESARRTMDRASLAIGQIEDELAALSEFPEQDPYRNHAMLKCDVRLSSGGIYTYVFLKVENAWYASGPKMCGTPLTWTELVEMYLSKAVSPIWKVEQTSLAVF